MKKNKVVTVGFDGFIDTIVRPIKTTGKDGDKFFETIREFGEFIASKADVSCSIELLEEKRKFGGNMPHLAYSLAQKGVTVNAVGMLGKNGITKEFEELAKICNVFSYDGEGVATALEFNDGKVFFAPKIKADYDVFEKISQVFDVRNFVNNDAFILVNYSELEFSYKLWNDIYIKVFKETLVDKSKFVFFDLCDCGRKEDEEIKEVLKLISLYNEKRTAVLSLNENEANILCKAYDMDITSLEEVCLKLREILDIDEIIIHTTKKSVISTVNWDISLNTDYIEKPLISTGSGDNFNASFVYAKVNGNSPSECLRLANYGAYFYVKNAKCATIDDMNI